MPACCIVYTTDQTYLFPTFLSATQARLHASPCKSDVMIFGFGVGDRAAADFAATCAAEGIRFVRVADTVLEGANAMMARLFMDRFVPAEYTEIIYMDGDTQISASLDPLVEARVPEEHFLAANDPMTFVLPEHGAQARNFLKHTAGIGLSAAQSAHYFNTGVLRINRLGWSRIGADAWRLVQARGAAFTFPDQDPLNAAAADRHSPMSLAWNFPIFMRNLGVQAQIRPAVHHFMSRPKPWQGSFQPWGRAETSVYQSLIARYPALGAYHTEFTPRLRMRYAVQQRVKQLHETLTWRMTQRRRRILSYEERIATPVAG